MTAQAAMATIATAARAQFHDLLERHRKIVFKVANTYCRNPHDRADLAQEIAAQCWRAFPGYDAQRSFSTWMYRIALNVAISFVRNTQHRDKHSVALDEELHDVATDSEAESDERVRELRRSLCHRAWFYLDQCCGWHRWTLRNLVVSALVAQLAAPAFGQGDGKHGKRSQLAQRAGHAG